MVRRKPNQTNDNLINSQNNAQSNPGQLSANAPNDVFTFQIPISVPPATNPSAPSVPSVPVLAPPLPPLTIAASSTYTPNQGSSTIRMGQLNLTPATEANQTFRIRLTPHLDSRSLHFDPITRDLKDGGAALRIGRFTGMGLSASAVNALGLNKLTFKSKVVSRAHAEIWVEKAGMFFIKDTESSSGTFLNHMRLSPENQESSPHQLQDGDILQLGMDYQGGAEDIHKCVKIRVEIGREPEWQAGANASKIIALKMKKLEILEAGMEAGSGENGEGRQQAVHEREWTGATEEAASEGTMRDDRTVGGSDRGDEDGDDEGGEEGGEDVGEERHSTMQQQTTTHGHGIPSTDTDTTSGSSGERLNINGRGPPSTSPPDLPSDPNLYKAYLCHVLSIKSADVIDLTDHIDRTRYIASGASGEVWEASWKGLKVIGTSQALPLPVVVVKLVRIRPLRDEISRCKRYKRMKRELELWSKLNHPHVLPLIGIACIEGDANLPAFISPLMENGNVMDFLDQNSSFSTSRFLKDIIKGLHYLHTFDPVIVHGDIKGANVLINHRKEACLCDFGLSRLVVDNTLWRTTATHASGTLRWMAPELMEGDVIIPTIATDIYAFGMTCYEILSKGPPFAVANDAVVISKVIKGQRPKRIEPCHSDKIWSIITRCWSQEPENRPSTEETLKRMMLTPQRIHIHHLLAFSRSNVSPLLYNFLHPPNHLTVAKNRERPIYGLEEPATKPPLSQMTITSSWLPNQWYVKVTASSPQTEFAKTFSPSSGSIFGPMLGMTTPDAFESPTGGTRSGYITVLDVLMALYASLRMNVRPSEYDTLTCFPAIPTYTKESVKDAFWARIALIQDPKEREEQQRKGVRRIDFLGSDTMFLGLVETKKNDEWELVLRE